jgi:hypothetical protein
VGWLSNGMIGIVELLDIEVVNHWTKWAIVSAVPEGWGCCLWGRGF